MPTRVSESKTCEAVARALVLLAALLLLPAAAARAQPSRRPVWKDARCFRLSHAQAAFVGRVVGFERVTKTINWGLGGGRETLRLVRFAVEEPFKGVGDKREVGVLTWLPESRPRQSACERDFEVGGSYLVYAYSWARQPELRTYVCEGGGVPLAEAADDLAYLRRFVKGEPVAEVAGRVEQYRHEYTAKQLSLVRALEGVEVTAEGAGRSLRTKTDAEGRYHFAGLVPGNYRLHIEVPEGFYTMASRGAAHATDEPCYQTDFMVESDGRVSGRANDPEGRPVSGASLELVPADTFPADESKISDEVMHGLRAASDADGRFEFRGVPGGRYILGTNLRGVTDYVPVEWNPPVIFPRTYYPGTPARDAARVIEVAEGGSVSGLALTLSPPPPRRLVARDILGTVVLSNGRPAPCAMVSLVGVSGGKAVSGTGSEIRVLEGGRFGFSAYEGYSYAVRAYVPVIDEQGRNVGRVLAEPAVVGPAAATAPLLIRIPPGGNCDFMTRPAR